MPFPSPPDRSMFVLIIVNKTVLLSTKQETSFTEANSLPGLDFYGVKANNWFSPQLP